MSIESLNCIIPAAGEATRLRPHSHVEQKPAMLMGSPTTRIIDFALDFAKTADEIHVITHHDEQRTQTLDKHISSQDNIHMIRDRALMGAASLIEYADRLFENHPDGSCAIVSADHIIQGISLREMQLQHIENSYDITMLTSTQKSYGQYVETDGIAATRMSDRPIEGSVSSTGIYLIKNTYMREWAARERANGWSGESRSLLQSVIRPSITDGHVATFSLPETAYWADAGTLKRYHYNNMRFSGGANVISKEATVHPDAKVRRSVILGRTAVSAGAMIESAIVSGTGTSLHITKVGRDDSQR